MNLPRSRRPLASGRANVGHEFMKNLRKSFLLLLGAVLAVSPLRAQTDDALPALVQLIGTSEDAQFQLDLLKGISEGLQGRRGVPMPAGWESIAPKLAASPNAQAKNVRVVSLNSSANS